MPYVTLANEIASGQTVAMDLSTDGQLGYIGVSYTTVQSGYGSTIQAQVVSFTTNSSYG